MTLCALLWLAEPQLYQCCCCDWREFVGPKIMKKYPILCNSCHPWTALLKFLVCCNIGTVKSALKTSCSKRPPALSNQPITTVEFSLQIICTERPAAQCGQRPSESCKISHKLVIRGHFWGGGDDSTWIMALETVHNGGMVDWKRCEKSVVHSVSDLR